MQTTIELFGKKIPIRIETRQYHDGCTAVVAMCKDGPFGRVTTNIEDDLPLGEIAVKTYSENSWVPQLLDLLPDVFQDTGKRLQAGYAELHVWRFKKPQEA